VPLLYLSTGFVTIIVLTKRESYTNHTEGPKYNHVTLGPSVLIRSMSMSNCIVGESILNKGHNCQPQQCIIPHPSLNTNRLCPESYTFSISNIFMNTSSGVSVSNYHFLLCY